MAEDPLQASGAQAVAGGPLASGTEHPDWERTVMELVTGVPRVLGRTEPRSSGPLLIVLGGLHGNEPAGVLALQRVFERLRDDAKGLRGELVGLAGNREALAAGVRFLARDLNRMWGWEELERLIDSEQELAHEENELRGLARELRDLHEGARERSVFFLDVHSTSGGGSAFTSLDDTLANRAFAFEIPVPHVLGLEEELAGTLVTVLNEIGITAIGFESGQHLDPDSVDRAEAAIWIAMEASGVLRRRTRREVRDARARLSRETRELPNVVEVRYRHPVHEGDGFRMEPGFHNFHPVRADEVLGRNGKGPVRSPKSGQILMPLYQGQGEDGFFLVHPVHFTWLRISAAVRRLRLERVLHLLPGVTRDAERSGAFFVDQRRARWLALQIFHLLGFRRAERTEHTLRMQRRENHGRSGFPRRPGR